jgi:phospholipase C
MGTLSKNLIGVFLGLALFSAGVSQGALPPIQTVFVIMMENHAWSEILGNTNAPYLNGTLLPLAAHGENYLNVQDLHPSLPNYLWLEAGTNFGIFDDEAPLLDHQNTTNHLVTLLRNVGVSWKVYQQYLDGTSLPLDGNCNCAIRHNPFVYFDDVTGTNNPYDPYALAHVRPYSEFATDLTNNALARYNWILPDDCNSMHSPCGLDPVQQGDNFLAAQVPQILNSAAYRNGGALFIIWDETDSPDVRLPFFVLSPFARAGYGSTNYYTHSSVLRTMQEIFQVGPPFLGDAAKATDLSDFFAPPYLYVANITVPRPGAVQLTAAGVATNIPLIAQCSTDLQTWTCVWTNLTPNTVETAVMTNNLAPRANFFRFIQPTP